jgi:NADH-quinone oxidoreductase subunit F
MSRNISKLSGRKGLENNLFEKVTELGQTGGDSQARAQIASDYNLGKATVFGSESFYEFLDPDHLDKKAWVCNGSACLCAGTQENVTQKLADQFGAENIGHMTCLGRCHENSAFHMNGNNYSGNAIDHLDDLDQKGDDNYQVSCSSSQAVLTGNQLCDIKQFESSLKAAFSLGTEQALAEIKDSGLRGRGGAGFPTGIKWESCRNIQSDTKYIVCNADEGDPGAYSDRYLMEYQPFKVLFGMVIAGWISGAREGVLYVRAEYPESISRLEAAIADMESSGLSGTDILGQGFDFNLKVIRGAGAYICGEETALIASIEGRRPEVDVRPPFPTEEGLFKQPTILNNVETFAAIPFILSNGGSEYANIGTESSTGTKLVCLDGGFNKPGLVEVEMGTPLIDVIKQTGGDFRNPVKALHIGGPLGGMVPAKKISELNISFESFSQAGFLLGHASVVSIPEDFAVADYLLHLFEFTKAESCGKCFPCRLGSTRGTEMFTNAIEGKHLLNRELLEDLLTTMEKGSLCALGGGLPLPIRNALQYFPDELETLFDNQIATTGKA